MCSWWAEWFGINLENSVIPWFYMFVQLSNRRKNASNIHQVHIFCIWLYVKTTYYIAATSIVYAMYYAYIWRLTKPSSGIFICIDNPLVVRRWHQRHAQRHFVISLWHSFMKQTYNLTSFLGSFLNVILLCLFCYNMRPLMHFQCHWPWVVYLELSTIIHCTNITLDLISMIN